MKTFIKITNKQKFPGYSKNAKTIYFKKEKKIGSCLWDFWLDQIFQLEKILALFLFLLLV